LAGGAAGSVLARGAGIAVTVVDVGVAGDLSALPQPAERRARFVAAKVRAGTADSTREPAMSRVEAEAALAVGRALAHEAAAAGRELLCAGEVGIGNSTAAAALLCALAGVAPIDAVGRGTGLDDGALAHKVDVVTRMLARHRPSATDPLATLAALGGLELAAMAGFMLGAAESRVPVVVDGFIAGTAALVAVTLEPRVRDHLVLSHRSAEAGAQRLSDALGLSPLLDLGLRLGEGTGALIAADLVRQAVRLQHEMATFSTAGVADRTAVDT
jgi:nicotinate-nucleotide--dimethylbenzimidazole phosphoribosyltransferase